MKRLAVVTAAFATLAAFSPLTAPAQSQLPSGVKAPREASHVAPRSQIEAMTPRPASSADTADAASSSSARHRTAGATQTKQPSNRQKLARFSSHPDRSEASGTTPEPYGYDGWDSSRVYANPATSN